jgi:hypothetical protein
MDNVLPQSCSFLDVPCHANWLVFQLESFGVWLYDTFLTGLAGLLEIVPVPDFLINIQPILIPSSVTFFLEPFQIEYGITILVSAYIARFIVRRLPVIG